MVKLSQNGLKVLKTVHLLIIAGWFGGGIAMNLLAYKTSEMDQQSALLTAFHMIDIIDMQLVATCALLTLITGLIYGILTHWGFFKHPWLVIKWIITVLVISSGVAFSSAYLEKMEAMVGQFGVAAIQNPEYLVIAQANLRLGIIQLIMLALAVILSIWKKPRRKRNPSDNIKEQD